MTAPDTPAFLISDRARAVGLSRATLRPYEHIGLLRGRRQANGHRVCSEADRRACLDGQRDTGLRAARLDTLEAEIAAKTRAHDLVAGLLGRGSLRDWLARQGFTGAEATQVALLSRDMHGHAACMADVNAVFAGLDLWGPGTPEARRRGIRSCRADHHHRAGHRHPARTRHPLRHDPGRGQRPYHRHRPRAGAVAAPAAARRHAGPVGHGLAQRPPDPATRAFWTREYPDMADVPTRLSQARAAGYRVLGRIDPGPEALDAYYTPLAARVEAMADRLACTQVMADLTAELNCWRSARGQFGYELFVLQRP